MANPFDNLSNEELIGLLGGGGLTFDQQMKIATAPRSSSSSSSNFSTSSQDPAQFAENMKFLREQLRDSSLGREQKTAIDKYLAQLQERNQRFVELKSAQDNLIKVAEQRETARQGDNNRRESARQANLKAAVDQYQTALSLIPQMGQLAIEESKRVQSILQDGGDFLARAFESRGGTSPLATVSQADQINAVMSAMSTIRQQINDALAGGPPDPNSGAFDGGAYQPPSLSGGFGAQLGEMPTLNIPTQPPTPEAAPSATGGGGFAGAAAQAPQSQQPLAPVPTPGYVWGDPAMDGYSVATAGDSRGPVMGSPQLGGGPVLQEDGSRVQAVDGGFVRFLPNGDVVQPNGQTINERVNTSLPGYRIPGGNAQDRYQNAMRGASQEVIDQITWGPKRLGGFLGGLYDMTPAGQRAARKGMSGYAEGGMTREGAFIVGDHPSGMPMGTEEMVVNPTNAPIKVIPNAQNVGFSRYATGTGNTDWMAGNTAFTGMDPQQAAAYAQATPGLRGGSYVPTPEARGGFLAEAGAGLARPTANMTYQGQQVDQRQVGFNSQGTYYSQGGKAVYEKDLDSNTGWRPRPNFTTQKELVEMARRTSPPALQALFNNTAVPAATALKSTVPGEEVYMKTPTARQWMALTPEEQKAAMARYNVEFNAGAGYVPNRIAAQYGSTGSRQRGFVGAAGL